MIYTSVTPVSLKHTINALMKTIKDAALWKRQQPIRKQNPDYCGQLSLQLILDFCVHVGNVSEAKTPFFQTHSLDLLKDRQKSLF